MNIAVIPARGGSKRIPGKNIREFCGKPIIAYSIDAALQSGVIDRVLVSTDDEQIAQVAQQYGAQTPFTRPAELSDDITPTVPVIRHATEWAIAHWGPVRKVCCIYATAPFVQADDVRRAYAKHENEGVAGYVFTATSFGFPIQRAFRLDADGYCAMFQLEHYNTRSQDLPEAFHDAGQFYWGSPEAYRAGKIFFSADSKPYVLPRYRVQDIDTLEDWTRAEFLWRMLRETAGTRDRSSRVEAGAAP
jgi:pseudaminic acid cytidylyltransferase